ncbi:BON domain-containing protein [Collimonas pratensis]|nr:BON domain-containing protein [Collimonas pratensis]
MLASRIRNALMASVDIPDLDIRIQIQKSRVVLSGFADNQAEIDRNLTLARQVKGVRTIVNHISIRQFT